MKFKVAIGHQQREFVNVSINGKEVDHGLTDPRGLVTLNISQWEQDLQIRAIGYLPLETKLWLDGYFEVLNNEGLPYLI